MYDFGGGTLDVSILYLDGGSIEVAATDGDTYLGGRDIDEALVKHCIAQFKREHKIDLAKPEHKAAYHGIRELCERAKI